ncbi:hypothetical protein V5799_016526 [Amblyomma americanum]|uniref:Uncharacterized protein n=1 Tax=Amblyomma americanum TaxID=6943 RepID=A0AAQ4F4V0_AMBAM
MQRTLKAQRQEQALSTGPPLRTRKRRFHRDSLISHDSCGDVRRQRARLSGCRTLGVDDAASRDERRRH